MTTAQEVDQPTGQLTPIATWSAPARGPGGLTWDGTHLWLADFQAKALLCLDGNTMALQRRLPSQGTPGGLTWDGHLLWQGVFGAGVAVGLDPETGQVQRRTVLPEERGPVLVAGLAWDGTYLWCGSQQDGFLYGMDVPGERVAHTLTAQAPLGGLTWDGQCLWAGGASSLRWDGQSWAEETAPGYLLLRLDPQAGQPVGHYPLPYWPMGLAWDGTHLWISDSQHGKLRQLAV